LKILVTGATGFVGSHLCEKLLSDGHEVYCLVRNKKKFETFKIPGIPVEGSLSEKGPNGWCSKLPADLDACVHIAGLLHSFSQNKFYEINTNAVEQLVLDLSKKYPTLKFLFLSSLSARGPLNVPLSHYGKSKLAGETALLEKAPSGWKNLIFRAPIVIGPRDPGILDLFKMVKSRLVLYPGTSGADNSYSFVSVYDLVNLIAQVLKDDQLKSGIFYPAKSSIIKYKDLVLEIKKLMGIKGIINLQVPLPIISLLSQLFLLLNKFKIFDFKLTPDKVLDIRHNEWVCDWRDSKPSFDFDFKWGLSEILAETLKDYRARNWI
jgi:nucleoside-diphosphate-sugar epimerase